MKNKMRIGIDARVLERKMTGVGRYVLNLIKNISSCDETNEYFIFSYAPLKDFVASNPNIKNIPTLNFLPRGVLQKLISPFWMNLILPTFLRREKIDLFFSPNHVLPFLRGKTKNVAVILDLFNIINKKFHSFLYRLYVSFTLFNSVKKSDAIITISEASKKDIIKFLKVQGDKVKVIYLAADDKFKPRNISDEEKRKLRARYDLSEEFILYVGVIEERKNMAGILKVADELLKRGLKTPIVLIGRVGYGGKKYIENVKNRENVFYRGFVEEADLPYIYNISSLFFFPSLYEGFGLPPLEAMRSGVPVVASNASSLQEVIGDGGIMLSPDDYPGFTDVIERIMKDDNLRLELIQKGLARASKFSFERMACETVETLNRVKQL